MRGPNHPFVVSVGQQGMVHVQALSKTPSKRRIPCFQLIQEMLPPYLPPFPGTFRPPIVIIESVEMCSLTEIRNQEQQSDQYGAGCRHQ